MLKKILTTSSKITFIRQPDEKNNDSKAQAKLRKSSYQFIKFKYPEGHRALDPAGDEACIAFVKYDNKYFYSIKLNPFDKRGYRSVVTYIGEEKSDIESTFNREYTIEEQRGLSDVTTLMIQVYKNLSNYDLNGSIETKSIPIVQTAQAGNDSHSMDMITGITQIGSEEEPSKLHTHIWGRGNPEEKYIPEIPIDGPKPGEIFDMRAKTPNIPGNQSKVNWCPKHMESALDIFKKVLYNYSKTKEFTKVFKDILVINIYQPSELIKQSVSFPTITHR